MSSTPKNIFSPSPRSIPAQQAIDGVIHQQLQLAKQLQARGELDPAIKIYEGALKVVPHHPAVLSNLTACLVQK
ncbi:MAG: hypothetical protein KGL57_11920, partial [Burkholderiales bacterium]|nr:hypothetical protein [Burkholderiales bacterium]